ncbi:MAG: precorrin-8X methylmutase [Syntrophomonadaceae bacterium]|jgi:precorrin-8X/cobalt-precorrin-8 methylmutase
MNIIWNPHEIEQRSMEIIESYLIGYSFAPVEKQVVKRVIHTTGDPDIVKDLRFHPRAIVDGLSALRAGAGVFTDVNMLKSGINAARLGSYGGEVFCSIKEPVVIEKSQQWGITRAAAAMRLFAPRLHGSIVAIGNAPTALFELLDLIDRGVCLPALVVGTPVGFVGAAESKEMLVGQSQVPYISLLGTRGGSPIAVSIINALLYSEGV